MGLRAVSAPRQPEAGVRPMLASFRSLLTDYRFRLLTGMFSLRTWLGSISLELRTLTGTRRDLALARCPRTRCFAADPAVRSTSLNAVQGTPWRRR